MVVMCAADGNVALLRVRPDSNVSAKLNQHQLSADNLIHDRVFSSKPLLSLVVAAIMDDDVIYERHLHGTRVGPSCHLLIGSLRDGQHLKRHVTSGCDVTGDSAVTVDSAAVRSLPGRGGQCRRPEQSCDHDAAESPTVVFRSPASCQFSFDFDTVWSVRPALKLNRSISDAKRYTKCSVQPLSASVDESQLDSDSRTGSSASRTASLPLAAAAAAAGSHPLQPLSEDRRRPARPASVAETTAADTNRYDVFLGGSCNPTTWRHDLAIPQLQKLNISYYNPQMASWHPGMVALEEAAKQSSRVLFFVIDNQTRAVSSMVEAAYLIASGRKLMLIVTALTDTSMKICDQVLSATECEELNRTRTCLVGLAGSMGLPIFTSVPAALGSIEQILYNASHGASSGSGSQSSSLLQAHQRVTLSTHEVNKVSEIFEGNEFITESQACDSLFRLTSHQLTEQRLREILSENSDVYSADGAVRRRQDSERANVPSGQVSFFMFCTLVRHVRAAQGDGQAAQSSAERHTSRLYRLLVRAANVLLPSLQSSRGAGRRHRRRSPAQSACCGEACREPQQTPVRRVGLVGDHSSADWFNDDAAPILVGRGVSVEVLVDWYSAAVLQSSMMKALYNCDWLLFVVSDVTRASLLLCLAAHCLGAGFRMVLCVQELSSDCTVLGEKLSPIAVKDYNRGRTYLTTAAERDDVPLVATPEEALQHILQQCDNTV